MSTESRAAQNYSPLYFLASLGAGGLVVTFFMFFLFWVKHPNQAVPVFEDIMAAFNTGGAPLQAAIVIAWVGIIAMAFIHFKTLIWNIAQLRKFIRSAGYEKFTNSNAHTQMMAVPLTLAMSVNVGFIIGMVFVPQLWSVVEYLFPMAIIAFFLIGIYAFRLLGDFLGRVVAKGGFDHSANNSFAQKLPAFALSMVGVGLAAPAAMSTTALTSGVAVVLSTFFLMTAAVIAIIALVMGIHSMMERGVAPEAAPTLMVIIPILTVLGILVIRQQHGLHVNFDGHTTNADTFVMLTRILSVQVLFGIFGLFVLKRIGYWAEYVFGQKTSAGAYALICPGVALSVMLHFWINKGLVASGIIAKFGIAYWALNGIALGFQVAMILLVLYLNRRHFSRSAALAVPAE